MFFYYDDMEEDFFPYNFSMYDHNTEKKKFDVTILSPYENTTYEI